MLAPDKKRPTSWVRERADSSDSSSSSFKSPRTPRFAEATTVHSPVDNRISPFADPPSEKTDSYVAQGQVADMGFGYLNESSRAVDVPQTPASTLKSALKTPGTPGKGMNLLSPTFREEQVLDRHEEMTEKEQAKDLKVKIRVRLAKVILRFVNFSCSLIVLAMLSSTFAIFNATRALPPRNNLPAWAEGTKTWPQIVVLVTACISLFLCLVVFYNYWKGGHRRAEKVAVYYTLFAVGFFIMSTIMWGLAAGILQGSKNNSNNKDIWGWSCVDNKRRELFDDKVNYALVCRMQSWSLVCCIIEVVLETLTIAIYGVVFYRYYSKQRLRKSMAVRDRARSDLYLAQLRSQSAPNTPGFGPLSPSYSAYAAKSPRFPPASYDRNGMGQAMAEEGFAPGTQFVAVDNKKEEKKPFALQAPPIKIHNASPKTEQNEFQPMASPGSPGLSPRQQQERRLSHVDAAPGEQTYASVPIPGAYRSPLNSPGLPPQGVGIEGRLGMHSRNESIGEAYTSNDRIESPPGSPRLWR